MKPRDAKELMAWLEEDDPVNRYFACRAVEPRHATAPGLVERLVELLRDGRDWDCGHYPAAMAAEALTRVDTTGRCWLAAASECFRFHVKDNSPSVARAILRAPRAIMDASAYLGWAREVVGDGPMGVDRTVSALQWYGMDWFLDAELVQAALVASKDRQPIEEELLSNEWIYSRQLCSARAEQDLAALRRYTKDIDPSLREKVFNRLESRTKQSRSNMS